MIKGENIMPAIKSLDDLKKFAKKPWKREK